MQHHQPTLTIHPMPHNTKRQRASTTTFLMVLATILATILTANVAPAHADGTTTGDRAAFTEPLLPAPDGDAFYEPPATLPGGPGDVIWSAPSARPEQDINGTPTKLTEVRVWRRTGEIFTPQIRRILYRSTDRAGRSVPAYALLVADPMRRADAPVIVSMHGWLGFGDHCGVMRGTWRSAWAHSNTMLEYLALGYTIIMPDGPGLAGPGEATPLINLDAARNLLDAARAARNHTNSTGRILFHGHSMGGTMALGVPAEAATYAPELPIAGIVSIAGLGHSGAGTPMWTKLLNDPKTSAGALLMQARMLAGSHPGEIDIEQHLTARGKNRYLQTENLCGESLPGITAGDRPEDLFKPSFLQLLGRQEGTYSGRQTAIPHYFVDSSADSVTDSLGGQHAHLRRCAAALPSWHTTVNASHWDAVKTAHTTTGLRDWIITVLDGHTPAGACAPHDLFLNVGSSYTAETLLATFADTTTLGTLRLDTRGDCRVRQQRLELSLSGRCAFSITEQHATDAGRGRRRKEGRSVRTGRTWHFDIAIR